MQQRFILACVASVLVFLPLFSGHSLAQGPPGEAAETPPQPAPRLPDGRVSLGPPSGETGLWLPDGGAFASLAVRDDRPGVPGKPRVGDIPFRPWARAVYDYRQDNQFEPHTRCKASGGARQFMTPYGNEFVELADRILIFDVGGPHTYRIVYMDGRDHPENLTPSYYGHSIGHWEGDTLVMETLGYNERFWLDRRGTPHTEQLRYTERVTRTSLESILYEVTIDDPGAYTKSWSTFFNLRWVPDREMWEYICQDNNFASVLMIGAEEEVHRASRIVP